MDFEQDFKECLKATHTYWERRYRYHLWSHTVPLSILTSSNSYVYRQEYFANNQPLLAPVLDTSDRCNGLVPHVIKMQEG